MSRNPAKAVQPEVTEQMLRIWMTSWLHAVELQRDRLLVEDAKWGPESTFWVFALYRVWCLAKISRRLFPNSATHRAIQSFERAVPDLQTVRDVAAHFEHYVQAEGRLQTDRPLPRLRRDMHLFFSWDVTRGDNLMRVTVANQVSIEIFQATAAARVMAEEVLNSLPS